MSSGEVLKSGWCANRWSNRIKVISKCCILIASKKKLLKYWDNKKEIRRHTRRQLLHSSSHIRWSLKHPNYLYATLPKQQRSPLSLLLPQDHESLKTISHYTAQALCVIEEGELTWLKTISGRYSMNPGWYTLSKNKYWLVYATLTWTTTANRRDFGIRASAYGAIDDMWSKDTAACNLMRDMAFGL